MTMVTRMVSLSALHLEHKFFHNPRVTSGLDDNSLEDLGQDIKKNGMIDIPKVQKVLIANGQVIDLVWDGQRRVRASLKVFGPDKEIEVIDRTEDPISLDAVQGDALLFDALRTTNRQELSSMELAEVALAMRSKGHSLAKIGAAIGRDASWVSKILTAHEAANPKLRAAWGTGQIPDEMFKDLAHLTHREQSLALETVLETRESGDPAEARAHVKELKELAKQRDLDAKPDKKAEAKTDPAVEAGKKNGHPAAVTGEQTSMWQPPPVVKKKDRPAPAMLEDILLVAKKKPPTHDYAKGVIDGIKFVVGELGAEALGKAWRSYQDRLSGRHVIGKVKKKAAPAKKAPKKAKRK